MRAVSEEYCIVLRREIEAKDQRLKDIEDEIAHLKAKANDQKAQNAKEKRLFSDEPSYDARGTGGIHLDAAMKAASLAESSLAKGGEIPYAAACLIILSRHAVDRSRETSTAVASMTRVLIEAERFLVEHPTPF